MYYGAIEAGGTKIIGAVGTKEGTIVESIEVKTGKPEETLQVLVELFQKYNIVALGVGAFGPIQLHKTAPNYGCILNSPKTQWKGFSFYKYFKEKLNCDIVIDTDVNVAALGEHQKGALLGVSNGMYITIGTGIGAGILVEGNLVHGMLHSEAGHILLQRHPKDIMECSCGCHSNCFESLAAGPALEKRTGIKGKDIPENHEVWDLESYYIAQALVNYTMILATERIVLGGGVMQQMHLFPKIKKQYKILMAGYMETDILKDLDQFIVPAKLNGNQGIEGALYLAQKG